MKKNFKNILSFGVIATTLFLNSCRDADLSPNLTQNKDYATSFTSEADVRSAIIGAYDRMTSSTYYGRDYIIYNEVRSDNAFANGRSGRFLNQAAFSMNADDAYASDTWTQIYRVVANANVAINQNAALLTGNQDRIKHYQGQAYVLRALAHFDLLKLYGQQHVNNGGMNALGVPYVTKINDKSIESLYPKRNTVKEVYTYIMTDLDKAIAMMNPSLDDFASRNYMTSVGAKAVKARVALYFKDYVTAEAMATQVINSGKGAIASNTTFSSTWSGKAQTNIIFALAASPTDNAGINGLAYIYRLNPAGGGYGDVVGIPNLYNIYSANDVRRNSTMMGLASTVSGGYNNRGKYPDTRTFGDDIPLIRIEEIYLILAEAQLFNGNAAGALVTLNKIPANRTDPTSTTPLSLYTVATLDNILLERRKELAFEGFRFDDLVRTGNAIPYVDNVRQSFGSTIPYGSTKLAFPIPNSELGANPNMVKNLGY